MLEGKREFFYAQMFVFNVLIWSFLLSRIQDVAHNKYKRKILLEKALKYCNKWAKRCELHWLYPVSKKANLIHF